MCDGKPINASDFYSFDDDSNVVITSNIPFCEQLRFIYDKNSDPKLANHVSFVVKFVDRLLHSDYEAILQDAKKYQDFKELINNILSTFKKEKLDAKNEEFLRLLALYHDIGKFIERDNHPQIGLYLMRDFYPEDRDKLIDIIAPKYFTLLCSVIQHHDKFGVVSTGESSLAIFSDIPYFSSNHETIDGVKKNFSFVCLCNILDMASNVVEDENYNMHPCKIDEEAIQILSKDWAVLIDAIDKSDGERETLKRILIQDEYQPFRAMNRIERILKCSTRFFPDIKSKIDGDYLEIMAPSVLQSNFAEFAEGFAHIAKLDYGLRFFRKIVEGICKNYLRRQGIKIEGEDNEDKLRQFLVSRINRDEIGNKDIKKIRDEITIKILKILERYVLRYRWFLKNDHDRYQRIGYELRSVLGNEKLTNRIIDSLVSTESEPAALNWIIDKSPIWSFD